VVDLARESVAVTDVRGLNFEQRLKRRHAAEWRFRLYGVLAVAVAVGALALLLATITVKGHGAFLQTRILVDVTFDAAEIDPEATGSAAVIAKGNYAVLAKRALYGMYPSVEGRRDKRALTKLISGGNDLVLRDIALADPSVIGTAQSVWLIASDDIDMLEKGKISRETSESDRPLSDAQIGWFDDLTAEGRVKTVFNANFFSSGDSREPELAGVWGATVGSIWIILVCLFSTLPVGVMTAVYLEEFAPKNRLTDIIEVNINNLAAVPSIVFGLLGLAVFLNFFGMPRSAPLVGGLVLALMTLPTIIIAGRAALQSVPPSIREAALGVGASRVQVVLHHVLPLATPGIMTGTIVGLARALGETAPLLMIGMVAFIVDIPAGPLDPATALPVQIYIWADSPERAFLEKTSAAILVLLAFLIAMNATAVIVRKKFERRW